MPDRSQFDPPLGWWQGITRWRLAGWASNADPRGVKQLCLALLLCALAAPAALATPPGPPPGGPPRGHGAMGTPPGPLMARAVAAALCKAELKQLGGDAFKAKYPTPDACLDAHADQARQILDTCSTAADPSACVRDAVGVPDEDGSDGDTPASRPAAPGGPPRLLQRHVAARLCGAERKSLGPQAFKAKYPTRSSCLTAMADKAAAIVRDAQTQCASSARKLTCLRAAIAKALGRPPRRPHR